jgi:thioesterase domain-containing protein
MNPNEPSTQQTDMWSRVRTLLTIQRETIGESSIVAIQPKGTRPPLFLVHGVGGGMLWGYSNLARELGTDQPIYAFKSRGMDGRPEWPAIEQIAGNYVRDLRKFQREGPYYIGGYCFGGNVAYEMARQLTAAGCEVAPLLLMNCWPNNSSYTRLGWSPVFLAKFLWNLALRLRFQIRQGARRPRDYFKWRSRWVRKKIKACLSQDLADRVAVEDIVDLSPQPPHERDLWRTHVQAWLRYQPQPYAGDVVLFRTRGHPLVCSFDPRMGWGHFVRGSVTVKICRGDHDSILEDENVAFTARQVDAVLSNLQSGTRAPARKNGHDRLQVGACSGYAPEPCKFDPINHSRSA